MSADSVDPSSMSIKELKASIIAFVGERVLQSKNFVEKSQLVDFLREQQEIARSKKDGVLVVPAGKYIMGDPCFAATDLLHLETFNETYYDSEDGEEEAEKKERITVNSKKRKGKAEKEDEGQKAPREARFNDTTVVTAFNTHYNGGSGSTWFADASNKYSFLINGGVIALVPFEYNPKFSSTEIDHVAHVVEFDKPARCFAESNGVLHFGDITIDSRKPMMAVKANKHRSGKSSSSSSGRAKPKRRKPDEYEDVDDDDVEEEQEEEEEEEEADYSDDNSDEDSGESEEEEEDFDDETWLPEEKPKKKKQKLQKSRSAAQQDSDSEEVDFD